MHVKKNGTNMVLGVGVVGVVSQIWQDDCTSIHLKVTRPHLAEGASSELLAHNLHAYKGNTVTKYT